MAGNKIGKLRKQDHSNWIVFNNDLSEVLRKATGEPCYYELRDFNYPEDSRLFLFYPEHECPRIREYVNWMLNNPLFRDGFITKSFDEGMENGFEVNTHQPTNYLFVCMSALRMPWEAPYGIYNEGATWDYSKFRRAGFTKKQSFYLSVNFSIVDDRVVGNSYNSNHSPFPDNVPFKGLKRSNYRHQNGLMSEGSHCDLVSGSWAGTYDLYSSAVQDFGFTKRPNDWGMGSAAFNPEWVEKVKQYFRGV